MKALIRDAGTLQLASLARDGSFPWRRDAASAAHCIFIAQLAAVKFYCAFNAIALQPHRIALQLDYMIVYVLHELIRSNQLNQIYASYNNVYNNSKIDDFIYNAMKTIIHCFVHNSVNKSLLCSIKLII